MNPYSRVEIRILGPGDGAVLARVAPDVFDNPIDSSRAAEFLRDPPACGKEASEGAQVMFEFQLGDQQQRVGPSP